jgi:succinate-semialdehyde dehydrogenase/glutarate-semialdehyde dehydrogenase
MVGTSEFTHVRAGQFVGGAWLHDGERAQATSPATGDALGTYVLGTSADVDRAVRAAQQAFPGWRAQTAFERAAAIRRLIDATQANRTELELVLAMEQGKPLKSEAPLEVDSLITYLELAAAMGPQLEGTMPPSFDGSKRVLVYRVPRGVVAGIQPWNFPLETIGLQLAGALAVGNAVVSVPAPTTTLSAHAFARVVEEAELPAGVFNLITGDGAVVGDALVGHPGVNAVAFTGSTATGQQVARRAAGKAQLLELGGNGPFVVLEDADLDVVVPAALYSSFYCAGQACTAAERILVHDKVYDELAERLAVAVKDEIKLGASLDEDAVIGPLNNEKVASKMDAHVADAVKHGAQAIIGGSRDSDRPTSLYWQPTVMTGITESMLVSREETFGPIAPLQRVSSEAEILANIHRSEYGLATAVFSRDLARALRVAEQVTFGTVVINDMSIYTEQHLPFGGGAGSASGLGRAQGRQALEQVFTDLKTVIFSL